MEESKTIKKISKVNVPITILQALCMVLTIGAFCYYIFSPAARAVDSAYSSIHDVQISGIEAILETERYREYGYSEAQLDVIKNDIENGIDVSKYTQKGQSIDEFISARESIIESRDRINKAYEKYSSRAMASLLLFGICILWTYFEKKERYEKYEDYLDEVE